MRLTRDHSLGKNEARKRVAGIAETLSDEYGLRSSWDGDDLVIKGSGVSGRIVVVEESVNVSIRLSFPLAMMESTIRASIQEALEEHLAE